MTRRNRSSIRKERIIMLASSVFVLAALTVTGVYVRNSNRAEKEDYVVDFEALEQGGTELSENMVSGEELDTLFAGVGTDDLDYDPSFQEANSQHVENTEDSLKSGNNPEKNVTETKTIEEKVKEKARVCLHLTWKDMPTSPYSEHSLLFEVLTIAMSCLILPIRIFI